MSAPSPSLSGTFHDGKEQTMGEAEVKGDATETPVPNCAKGSGDTSGKGMTGRIEMDETETPTKDIGRQVSDVSREKVSAGNAVSHPMNEEGRSDLVVLFEESVRLFDENQLDVLADLILSRQIPVEGKGEHALSKKALLHKSLEFLRNDGRNRDEDHNDDAADDGVPAVVIAALIVLGTHEEFDEVEDGGDEEEDDIGEKEMDEDERHPLLDSSVSIVGSYLLSSVSTDTKSSMLSLFLYLLPVRRNQLEEEVDNTVATEQEEKKEADMEREEVALLEYMIGASDKSAEEGDFLHRHPTILMIRDYCSRNQPLRQDNNRVVMSTSNKNQEPSIVSQTGDVAAEHIASAARFIEHGLASSVPLISRGIDAAGEFVKEHIPENDLNDETTTTKTRRDADVVAALTYTSAARRATGGIRETARAAAFGLRDASARGITYAAEKFEEKQLGEKLVPNQDSREAVAAAGKIGLATLGAVAVVTEAMYETTKAVAQKGVSVTADVVRHRYGDAAGQVVEDTGETTGNVLRTIAHVGMLEGKGMAHLIAKRTGKDLFEKKWQNGDKGQEEKGSDDDGEKDHTDKEREQACGEKEQARTGHV